jgi:ribosomal protein RSM22 (predicted rRNA methylase)
MAAPFDRALRDAIARETAHHGGAMLSRAVEALSRRYRDAADPTQPTGPLTDTERLAYAVVRLPATAAALDAAFEALATHAAIEPTTVTDLGAGPATVAWPAVARWPGLRRIALVDRDPDLLALGRRLLTGADGGPAITHHVGDLVTADAPAADLVVLSYALGELAGDRLARAVNRALALATGAVVIVEPGTPTGFERIRAARDRLRASGATLVAPCPHADACPMTGGDWCHFAVRLDRSRAHRQSKQAALGWEDEKFSYVIAVPGADRLRARAAARIVRRPIKGTGHVRLALCATDGLGAAVVTRRDPAYRAARDASWGDSWPPSSYNARHE